MGGCGWVHVYVCVCACVGMWVCLCVRARAQGEQDSVSTEEAEFLAIEMGGKHERSTDIAPGRGKACVRAQERMEGCGHTNTPT